MYRHLYTALTAAKEPGRNMPYDEAIGFAARGLLACLLAVGGRRSRCLAIRAMRMEWMMVEDTVSVAGKDDG